MQKTNCDMKSELPSGKKQDHALKNEEITRERLNKGTFVVSLWHHSYYFQFLQKCATMIVTIIQ